MPSCRYHYYYYFLFTNDFIDKLLCIDRSYKFSWSILPDGGLSRFKYDLEKKRKKNNNV